MSEGKSLHGFQVVETRAGHRAMLDQKTGEVMHPVVGPLRESDQLFVGPSRLSERLRDGGPMPLRLLDVGLGAGSNAAAALRCARSVVSGRPLEVVSFDRTLDALALATSVDHAAEFGFSADLQRAAWTLLTEGRVDLPVGNWRVVVGELPDTFAAEPAALADVAFWDAFSPRRNPELWSVAAFTALRRLCSSRATVHTYSGATATRSALLLAGFFVGYGEALGGNKRATVAASDPEWLREPLGLDFLDRLSRSTAPLPADAPTDALERLRQHPQFS